MRLSGQDSRRGTFSHRHSVLVDYNDGHEYTPLAHVRDKQGTFEVRDSPLSEGSVLGFDWGYSLDMPEGLTIWEAQFGDFVNAAQVIIDQFLCSSEAKWHRVSGLVMLLPHGMEGQGPEHSNARLDRFLNLCVNDNMQVCNLTTPAQYFHCAAAAGAASLPQAADHHVARRACCDRPRRRRRWRISRADRSGTSSPTPRRRAQARPARSEAGQARAALHRQGLLRSRRQPGRNAATMTSPSCASSSCIRFARTICWRCCRPIAEGTPVVWVQEEPKNMGAWAYMNRELQGLLAGSFHWSCVSRPLSASPATGSTQAPRAGAGAPHGRRVRKGNLEMALTSARARAGGIDPRSDAGRVEARRGRRGRGRRAAGRGREREGDAGGARRPGRACCGRSCARAARPWRSAT